MNWLKEKNEKITFAYILCFICYIAVNDIAFFVWKLQTVNKLIYPAFAVVGGLLLLLDLFCKRRIFKAKGSGWLIGFAAAIFLSTIVNASYGIGENIKTMVWTCVIMLLMYPFAFAQTRDAAVRQIKIIANVLGVITLVCSVVSMYQYLFQIYFEYRLPNDPSCPQGFVGGRLYGVFTDPNYASVLMLCVIALGLFYIFNTKSRWMKAFHIVNIVFSSLYVLLGASRTAQLVFVLALFVVVSFALYRYFFIRRKKRVLALVLGILIGASSAAVGLVAFEPIRYNLGYMPGIILQMTDPNSSGEPLKPIDDTRPDVGEDKDISNHRFEIWSDAVRLWQATPVVGTSPRNHLAFAEEHFPNSFMVKRQYSTHNGYLSVLTYTGVAGALMVLGFIASYFIYLCKKILSTKRGYPTKSVMTVLAIIIMLTIAAFPMMMIFFLNTVREFIFWLMLGYIIALTRLPEDAAEKPPVLYRLSEKIFSGKVKHES
ncbi:O-antigen ligase family protein [Candidatus Soleaferrea massiliensis]|uniref:O-antigen ligase family protein n=1 Tax=Candidatus Soleaferrea massiliensis TaxID=1470354 RepID=UPI0005901A16|nr:O-antigen ligase family protein [Candidatus Soleaferrea massiliensis]